MVKPPVKDTETLCDRPFVIILNVVYSVSDMKKRAKENFMSANMNHIIVFTHKEKTDFDILFYNLDPKELMSGQRLYDSLNHC